MNVRVWYDEFTLRIGDSLMESIDPSIVRLKYFQLEALLFHFLPFNPIQVRVKQLFRDRTLFTLVMSIVLDISEKSELLLCWFPQLNLHYRNLFLFQSELPRD